MQIRRAVGRTQALRSAGWPTIFSYFEESALASMAERPRNFAMSYPTCRRRRLRETREEGKG